MTKRKPDTVIEYRISLQDKQSEQLDDIVTAYMIGNVLPSVVSLMKDVTGMIVLLSILAGLIGFKFRPVGLDVPDVIDEFLTQRQQAIAAGVIISGGPPGSRHRPATRPAPRPAARAGSERRRRRRILGLSPPPLRER